MNILISGHRQPRGHCIVMTPKASPKIHRVYLLPETNRTSPLKIDAWFIQAFLFWVSAYFQGQTCVSASFQGPGYLSHRNLPGGQHFE